MKLEDWLLQSGTSQAEFAKRLELTQGAVSHWITGRTVISPEVALKVAKATGYQVRPHDLRADIYPNPADAMPLDRVAA